MRDRYQVSQHFRCKEEEIKTEYLNKLAELIEQTLKDDADGALRPGSGNTAAWESRGEYEDSEARNVNAKVSMKIQR